MIKRVHVHIYVSDVPIIDWLRPRTNPDSCVMAGGAGEKRKNKRLIIVCIVIVVCIAALALGLGLGLGLNKDDDKVSIGEPSATIVYMNYTTVTSQPVTEEHWSRIDCYPEQKWGVPSNDIKTACEARGCTYDPAVPDISVPVCYVSTDSPLGLGYEVTDSSEADDVLTLRLQLRQQKNYVNRETTSRIQPADNAVLEANYLGENVLRIKQWSFRKTGTMGTLDPLTFPPFSFPFPPPFPFLSFPSFSLPSPFLPFSSPPIPLTQLGGLGERCKLPQWGLGRSPILQLLPCDAATLQ
jgi:hypothetical protein